MRDEHALLAKAFCTVKCRETVGYARELLGGNGILLENHIGRFVADAEAIYSYESPRIEVHRRCLALSIRRIAIAPLRQFPLAIALISLQDDRFPRSVLSLAANKISFAALMTGGSREVMRKCAMISPHAIDLTQCHS